MHMQPWSTLAKRMTLIFAAITLLAVGCAGQPQPPVADDSGRVTATASLHVTGMT